MKICLINSLYLPYSRGGAEVVVENIVQGLKKKRAEVIVITLGRNKEVETKDELKIYRIKPKNIFSFLDINQKPIWLRIFWHPLDVFNFSSYFQVKKILKKEKPDTVMTHNLKGIGYFLPRLIKKLKIKHVHVLHDVQLTRPSGLLIYGVFKPFFVADKIYEKICRFLFGSPEVVISPSWWLLGYYKRRGFFYRSKQLVIPNPIMEILPFIPETEISTDRKINLLYIGQLENHKGILFLIEALKKISLKNWRLNIVGDGRLKDKVLELIKNEPNFKFYGSVKHSQIKKIFQQADLTIVSSFCYENSPAVIYESLAFGVPVIASDIGGIPELVKDDYNGFTFEPRDEKNLIEVLTYYLSYPERILKLKKNAQNSVKDYTLDKYLEKILKLFS